MNIETQCDIHVAKNFNIKFDSMFDVFNVDFNVDFNLSKFLFFQLAQICSTFANLKSPTKHFGSFPMAKLTSE